MVERSGYKTRCIHLGEENEVFFLVKMRSENRVLFLTISVVVIRNLNGEIHDNVTRTNMLC